MSCYETPNSTSPMIVTTSLNTEGVPSLLETLAALQLPIFQQFANSVSLATNTSSASSNASEHSSSAFHPVTTASLFSSSSSDTMALPQIHLSSPTSLPIDTNPIMQGLSLTPYISVSISDCSSLTPQGSFLPSLSSQAPSISSSLLSTPTVLTPISVGQHIGGQSPLTIPSIHISPTFALQNYLELPQSSFDPPSTSSYRRSSAPEGSLRTPLGNHERRRYSDFTVESLLRQPDHLCWPLMEKRTTASGRKQRTIYGLRQTEVLEEAFNSQKYMVGTGTIWKPRDYETLGNSNRRSKQRKMSRVIEEEERKKCERERELALLRELADKTGQDKAHHRQHHSDSMMK
ncbi:hypothetical protein WR25_14513 [Diploscapter pachys]|uniref:Uncharacterized protein n=1 Tax=Diploscapter pachys TaxID=2018661 RepID=A0A2A2JTW6_9BILA|nr:hypothetical protein WR25_14513 [Diploscapter pachys]